MCIAVNDDPWFISFSHRTLVFPNGSLEINVTSLKDSGNFTCIASNAAGESTGRVELVVTAMPHLANSTSRSRDPSSEPAPSDILTSSKVALPNNETRGADRRVSLVELTGNSALIRWSSQTPTSGVRMFQVQYNSSGDDTLVYRSVCLSELFMFWLCDFHFLVTLVLRGIFKVPPSVPECDCEPLCVWVYKETSAAAVRGWAQMIDDTSGD